MGGIARQEDPSSPKLFGDLSSHAPGQGVDVPDLEVGNTNRLTHNVNATAFGEAVNRLPGLGMTRHMKVPTVGIIDGDEESGDLRVVDPVDQALPALDEASKISTKEDADEVAEDRSGHGNA